MGGKVKPDSGAPYLLYPHHPQLLSSNRGDDRRTTKKKKSSLQHAWKGCISYGPCWKVFNAAGAITLFCLTWIVAAVFVIFWQIYVFLGSLHYFNVTEWSKKSIIYAMSGVVNWCKNRTWQNSYITRYWHGDARINTRWQDVVLQCLYVDVKIGVAKNTACRASAFPATFVKFDFALKHVYPYSAHCVELSYSPESVPKV